MTDCKKDYKQQIDDLLSHYEDGRNIFKAAHAKGNWEYPVRLKPGSEDKGLPDTWLGVAAAVGEIIAHEKYGLDTYPNQIEIITADRMLDLYTSIGMPVNYHHWSYGKNRAIEGDAYKKGQMGLAYEIVINTNPSIAYCMEENSPMMQILVINHACFGHNSFFKGNHLFRQFTRPDDIIQDFEILKNRQREYEEKYGIEAVESLIDSCHALQSHGVYRYRKPQRRTPQEEKQRREQNEEHNRLTYDDVMMRTARAPGAEKGDLSESFYKSGNPMEEENLLMFVAENAPHLDPWQRDMMTRLSRIAQYFYPQKQTQVMNEGWATFWHHTIVNDLHHELDLIDAGMMLEFISSHTNVVLQPDFDHKHFSGFNPYALGFGMYTDIKRICENPTEEDREWFPEFAGNPDWVSVLKEAMLNHKDESFVRQYLSPKLMRDFQMFVLTDDDREMTMEISAIHDHSGYKAIRRALADSYDLGNREPRIEVGQYHIRGNRNLVLFHTMHNRRPLEERSMQEVLTHLYMLWSGGGDRTGGHKVILHSVDDAGDHVSTLACPPLPKGTDPKSTIIISGP